MAKTVSKQTVNGVDYEIMDSSARADVSTLGTQVGSLETQVGNLGTQVANVESDTNEARNSVNQITGTNLIHMIPGKYIDLAGSTVPIVDDKPAITGDSSAGYEVGYMPCVENDLFMVSGHGGDQTRLWAFIDSEGNILSVAPRQDSKSDYILLAPEDSAFIIVHSNDGRKSYKGYLFDRNWKYNTIDLVHYMPKINKTGGDVKFLWSGDTCLVNGTQTTGNVWNFLLNYTTDPVPSLIVPGGEYYLRFDEGANENVAFAVAWALSGTVVRRDYLYDSAKIVAPDEFDAISVALVVREGDTVSNKRITCRLFTVSGASGYLEKDIDEIKDVLKNELPRNVLLDFGNFRSLTSFGVSFTWESDHEHCIINGTGSGGMPQNFIWMYTDGLPEEIKPGQEYDLVYSASVENKVAVHVWYLLSDNEKTNERYFESTTLTIPEDCIGISIRLDVTEGVTCNNVNVGIKLMSKLAISPTDGASNHVSKMFSVGSSFMTGWIYKHDEQSGTAKFDHACPYDSTPYGNIAIGLGIEQKNVLHKLLPSTGLLYDAGNGNIIDYIKSKDLSEYDYVLTQFNRPDMGAGTNPGFDVGDLTSEAGDGTIVGAVLDLLEYMRTNCPNATLILVGAPPSDPREAYRGANVFTAEYNNGKSIGEADLMMHRLAQQEHFIFIDWEDLNLSYYYYTLCDDGNVHPRDDATCRMMGMYLARQCNYTTSLAKVLKADSEG